jgi:hypothetical protein
MTAAAERGRYVLEAERFGLEEWCETEVLCAVGWLDEQSAHWITESDNSDRGVGPCPAGTELVTP